MKNLQKKFANVRYVNFHFYGCGMGILLPQGMGDVSAKLVFEINISIMTDFGLTNEFVKRPNFYENIILTF